jgi:hypothetical protein
MVEVRLPTRVMMVTASHESKGLSHSGYMGARSCRHSTGPVYVRVMRTVSKCVAVGSPESCHCSVGVNY